MKYEELYADFKKKFPEDAKIFEQLEMDNHLKENDQEMIHVYFGLVVCPYVYKQIKVNDNAKLEKIFAFFEEMANSHDLNVQDVLQFSVLENITTENKEIYSVCKKFMGSKTKEFVNCVAEYMDIEQ